MASLMMYYFIIYNRHDHCHSYHLIIMSMRYGIKIKILLLYFNPGIYRKFYKYQD